MLASWLAGIVLALSAFVVMADDGGDRPPRIAIVNVSSLLKDAPQAKAATDKLKANFQPREKALDAEQKAIQKMEDGLAARIDAGLLSDDEKLQQQRELRDRQRKYNRATEDFREEVNAAREIAIDNLQLQIIQAIGEVREKEKIDIILRESDYIVASDRIDITNKVMDHLAQKFAADKTAADAKSQE